MKKAILFSLVFIFVIFNWALNLTMKLAEAQTSVYLVSPADSFNLRESAPTFQWRAVRDVGLKEIIRKYHIVVARDFGLTDHIWQDSTILPTAQEIQQTVYAGSPFEEWKTYFWSVRVQVDSIRSIDKTKTPPETTFVTFWYRFVKPPLALLYTTAKIMEIPDTLHNLRTIQDGIIWATAGDSVLVKPGIYYENLRFNKKGVILASHFARNDSIATIDSTIIDGGSLTRGQDNGSVIYFTSDADSNSKVVGFTLRNGKGTKAEVGANKKVNGGGIFCESGSTPTIAYNVITQNHVPDDGGGIFLNGAAPNIFNNIITQNSAEGSGGAIQCYYSIKTKPSTSSSSPGGKGEEDTKIEIVPESNSSSTGEMEKSSPSEESNSKTKEEDLKNSLYPKDATEVSSALSSDPLAKVAYSSPPVAKFVYYVKRDTIVQREKILVGDTIVLDGSGSSPGGDTIKFYRWKGQRWQRCEISDDWRDYTVTASTGKIVQIPVTSDMGGRYKIWLKVEVAPSDTNSSASVYLNLQRPPRADAGGDIAVAPGDIAWLDGSASCDINPDDDTLGFLWTQVSGPVNVTLVNSDSAKAYFVAYDTSYLGVYSFNLKVIDSDTFSLATKKVSCSNPPVAVCLDSLAGFVEGDSLPLDASRSFDPDSGAGDFVKYFIWQGSLITCRGTFPLKIGVDSTKKVQRIPASNGGGIYRLTLHVRDKFGVRSKKPDTLLISVQLPPEANAGPDTIVRTNSWAYLHGSACEKNWDQVSSLKYRWFKDPLNPISVTLFPDTLKPEVYFISGSPGVFRFSLRVIDALQASSWPDDTVRVIFNQLPKIDSITVKKGKFVEGDSVEMKAWVHDDTADVRVFGDSLTYNWTALNWPSNYKPIIINPTKAIAKFIPVKHGIYVFQFVVHDTLSPKQYPPSDPKFNITTKTIEVDTTFAYTFIMGNLIWANSAGLKGGGVDCIQSSPEIINNIFYKNKSGSSGGAICLRSVPSPTSIESSAPSIRRNIFFGNISGDSTGGAIANLKAELSPSATIGFREKAEVDTNDFWNNAGGNLYRPPADVIGNIYVFPRLVDPEYGDFRLECTSPCRKDSIGVLRWLYPDSCGRVPHWGMISLSLFQNPVATAVAQFLVNTDVPLKAPPVGYVTIGENSPTPVDFTSISSTTYRGTFLFSASDTAHISIFASSVQEQDTSIIRDFAVQLIGAGKIGKLVSPDNRLRVSFSLGAIKDEIYATCIPVSDDPQYNFEDGEKEALGKAYQLGPLLEFNQELTISFPLDHYNLSEKDKTLFSIYRHEKDGWQKETCFLDENSICAKVSRLGVYRLVYDENQEHIAGIPKAYQLSQNYPNPFNPQTMIKYDLPEAGHVNITVYNILGQKVKALVDEYQEAGYRSANWDGKDETGKEVASGIYFYKIKAVGFEKTKKMVLLK